MNLFTPPGASADPAPPGGLRGIVSGRAVAAALVAGASAAQLGTAFMLTPEAATAEAHRRELAGAAGAALTRAFATPR